MTTVILVSIGILIAAVAALMVVWFGGDAFGRSGEAAQAAQLINTGQNVLSAFQVYLAQNGTPATSYAQLVSTRDYMSERPNVASDLGFVSEEWRNLSGSGNSGSFAITGVPEGVCRRINRSLRQDDSIPTDVMQVMGCISHDGSNVFYVRLQGRG